MPHYAAFLRGMNLGKRRIKNPELVRAFEELGFSDVGAFLASGNVIFSAKGALGPLEKKIEVGLRAALSYDVPTFLRTEKDLLSIAEAKPFSERKAKSRKGKLQVAFLANEIPKGASAILRRFEGEDDWLTFGKKELFWWPVGGLSESELDLKGLEKALGTMTIRNHRTIDRMVQKYFRGKGRS